MSHVHMSYSATKPLGVWWLDVNVNTMVSKLDIKVSIDVCVLFNSADKMFPVQLDKRVMF
jgi:hypothetical protein